MIRAYHVDDCDEVLDVWAAASALAQPFIGDRFLQQERQQIRDVHLPQAETWVWEADDHVVGFISLLGNEVGAISPFYPSVTYIRPSRTGFAGDADCVRFV